MEHPPKETAPERQETIREARSELWQFIQSEKTTKKVLPPESTSWYFLFTPGFPLPGSLVEEDLLRIPDDEVIIFSEAHDGALTREEFDAYSRPLV